MTGEALPQTDGAAETSLLSERECVAHSWCIQSEWDAATVVGGSGAFLHLQDGRRLLDMSSLAECSNLGHQHPAVVAAIRAQAEALCFVTSAWGAQPRAELAGRLLELAGFQGGRVFFTLAGADANENAVRIARLAANRPNGWLITRERSYHGATHFAMALSGDARSQGGSDRTAWGIEQVPPPYFYRCPFGSANAAECGQRAAAAVGQRIDELGRSRVAAVLMEPNAGSNGIVPPDSYWPALRQVTRERDVWLIADEVMSGFGRCGEWFAWQRHGAQQAPDLITLAKGLTGAALPLGAVLLSPQVAGAIEEQELFAGLTYCGHPLCCAAGLAAVRIYAEAGLIERSRNLGAAMLQRLELLLESHRVIGDVRGGHGLFVVLELVSDRELRTPLAPWPQTDPRLRALLREALNQGVSFASRGNLILLAPPLVIETPALDAAIDLLDRLLAQFFPN